MRWGLLCSAAFVGALACQSGGFFVCNDDADCGSDRGTCQPTGACSFPDDACDSGQRYGESSLPSIAGECVPLGDDSGGSTGPDTTAPGATDSGPPTVADSTAGACPADWWDCAWSRRQRIELRYPVATPLTDVPLLVLLTAGRVDHDAMQADGEDLRFVSASGAVAPHEVERWDPSGVSTLWVGVDELGGAADHLWIYYGNPVAERAEDSSGVWPAPYVGVWHLHDDPLDSTGNANDGSPAGATDVVAGHLANGREFFNSSARVDVEPSPSLADVFTGGGTISAWARAQTWGSGNFGRIVDKAGGGAGWLFFVGGSGRLFFGVDSGPDGPVVWATAEEVLSRHRWTYVAVTYDALGGSLPRLYVDGVEHEIDTGPEPRVDPEVPTDVELPLTLGNRPANDRRFDGTLDEVRVETTIRSPEWIAVQHDAMRDALLDYGAIESQGAAP